MNKIEQEQFFDDFTSRMKKVMVGKGNDYALEKDRLSNFKNVGIICGSGEDGRQACLHLIATKVARLTSLLGESKTPSNESIDDSILDLANYSILLGMLQSDSIRRKANSVTSKELEAFKASFNNPESDD